MSLTTHNRPGGKSNGRPTESILTGTRRPAATMAPRRSRSWGLVTLAALLVLGTGLAVAAWGLHAGQKTSVLEVSSSVAKGQVVQRQDLTAVAVSGVQGAISVDRAGDVVGKTAAVDLVPGQVLVADMVTGTAVPAAGQSVVGLSLDPAAVPGAGLDPGDAVDLIAVPGADGGSQAGSDATDTTALDSPTVLASRAQVYAVSGQSTAGGQVVVTVVVDADDAARIAAYSAAGRVAVVESSLATETSNSSTGSSTGPSSGGQP